MDQLFSTTDNSIRSYNTMLPTTTTNQQATATTMHHHHSATFTTPPTSSHQRQPSSPAATQQQEQTYPNYHQPVTVQPVPIPQKSAHANTFVHKLYNMVLDDQFQHLIAWNYTGASFIVCNILEFARDVLPKHFKHNNFSSFVRQLNMYGFHKVNKSPRGHRTLAENQIWEFSSTNFLRDRPDLLVDIKRKTMESDTVRRETGDLHAHMAMMQVSQSDMLQQINNLYDSFSQIVQELHEAKQKQESHSNMIKSVVNYISQQNGGQLPQELSMELKKLDSSTMEAPSIFVTTPHDQQQQQQNNNNTILQNFYNSHQHHTTAPPTLVPSHQQQRHNTNNLMPSPSSTTFSGRNTLPPSPSPSMLLSSSSDDDNNSYYSSTSQQQQHNVNLPTAPHVLSSSANNNSTSTTTAARRANAFSFINNDSSMTG